MKIRCKIKPNQCKYALGVIPGASRKLLLIAENRVRIVCVLVEKTDHVKQQRCLEWHVTCTNIGDRDGHSATRILCPPQPTIESWCAGWHYPKVSYPVHPCQVHSRSRARKTACEISFFFFLVLFSVPFCRCRQSLPGWVHCWSRHARRSFADSVHPQSSDQDTSKLNTSTVPSP